MFNMDSNTPLGIHFANGARAFGADFSSDVSLFQSSFTATLSLNNGEQFTFTAPASPNSVFFGFISPTPFTDITFSDGGIFRISPGVNLHEEKIGNLYVVLEIPEPSGAVFLALGAAALFWRRR